MMMRRDFITLLGGAATWPLAAGAQQGERMRRIGVLMPQTADDQEAQTRVGAFVQALSQLGWTIGHNVRIDYRWGTTYLDRGRRYAEELVALAPDVILSSASASTVAAIEATRTVPIVFVGVVDPVGAGYVNSLARPGGNATGFLFYAYSLGAKWLELLKELAPQMTRTAVIRDPAIPAGAGQFGAIQSVAPSIGVELSPLSVREPSEIENAVAAFARGSNGGLIATGSHWRQLIAI